MEAFNTKWKDQIIEGSTFPDDEYSYDVRISFTNELINEYIPTSNKVLKDYPKAFRLLLTIMAAKEGFYKGTRSYRNNNPGNIGNTDSGLNRSFVALNEGILAQKNYIERILTGKNKAYPINKEVVIKPYFSKEIANNQKTYKGKSPYLPGYKFVFTGQLDQFVKIYSTGARSGNSYLNMILSYFKNHGIYVTPETTLKDFLSGNLDSF
jgi:hypothetical protein